MALDVSLTVTKPVQVFEANITHNLGEMASKAGLYEVLWMPEVFRPRNAADLIVGLEKGIDKMKKDPDFFRQFDAKNGCGTYDQFLPWLEKYLAACKENPEAEIRVSR